MYIIFTHNFVYIYIYIYDTDIKYTYISLHCSAFIASDTYRPYLPTYILCWEITMIWVILQFKSHKWLEQFYLLWKHSMNRNHFHTVSNSKFKNWTFLVFMIEFSLHSRAINQAAVACTFLDLQWRSPKDLWNPLRWHGSGQTVLLRSCQP